MDIAFEIALRYLRARKGDGFVSALVWFALIGIALGVGTLIIVMSVMNGFRHDLQSRILGVNGHINIHSTQGITDYNDTLESIRSLEGVDTAYAVIDQQVLLVGNGRVTGGMARGLRWQALDSNKILHQAIHSQLVNNTDVLAQEFDGGSGLIIGKRMAWNLGLSIGDTLTVLSPQVNTTAFGSSPRRKSYTVAGLFNVGMSQYDSSYVFMPLAQAQKLFRLRDQASHIEVTLTDAEASIDAVNMITPIIQQDIPNVRITPWQYAHASFFQALQVERNVMFLILSLVVTIAAFNIIISQVMMVREKAGSIAILRAVGIPRHTMMAVFFYSGTIIGGVGTLAGVILGMLFALNIESIRLALEWLLDTQVFSPEVYFLSTLPSRFELDDTLRTIALALGLTFAASMYAAWQAIKVDPVKVLRHAR